jgi:isoaspartyl peptidase/L-asparaginase-like protein (Ntn-hydrolase superfamily)
MPDLVSDPIFDRRWTLMIHGGAGMMTRDRLTPEQDSGIRAGLAEALDAGSAVLDSDGLALDAVAAAVRVLEDDPHFNAGRGGGAFDVDMKYGTVGAVACDVHGHVAAATSTGGVTGKRWGRVGDSPLIGAGTYADDRACAVSATGAGEFFIRAGVAHEICARVRLSGESVQSAADAVLADVRALGGTGGVIVAAPNGDLAWSFITAGMNRARATSDGARSIAIYSDE